MENRDLLFFVLFCLFFKNLKNNTPQTQNNMQWERKD